MENNKGDGEKIGGKKSPYCTSDANQGETCLGCIPKNRHFLFLIQIKNKSLNAQGEL